MSSWIDRREVQSERANLQILFEKYVPTCLDTMKMRFKKITPIADISHLQMLCSLLECMFTPENIPADSPKELYELYFCFCCVWAFGASMLQDQVGSLRRTAVKHLLECIEIKFDIVQIIGSRLTYNIIVAMHLDLYIELLISLLVLYIHVNLPEHVF